jgi:acetylglutamate kinase
LLREAGEFAAIELAKAELPQITKNRLVKSLAINPPVKEGKLDAEAFRTQIAEAVKAEIAYLVEVTGGGRITGMGASQSNSTELKPEELTESLTTSFKAIGYLNRFAKAAAQGGR